MKAVILAGGGGTRLWPLSTEKKPKQFQNLVSEKTMLEETVGRLDFLEPKDIYIAINEKHLKLVKKLCPKIPDKNIIIEPALRDTASCIGLAACIIEKRHPGEVMAVIYADHLIKNKAEFQRKLKVAEKLAKTEGSLNIIEVKATEPNPNFGYVKLGKLFKKIEQTEVYNLDSFVEKPSVETAKKFIKTGKYLWNTGIYVWKTKTLLEKYREFAPDSYKKLSQIMYGLDGKNGQALIKKVYPTLQKISIDYAIMEKVPPKEVKIIKADLGWSDIGNWESIWKELTKKPKDNVSRGNAKLLDCERCIVYADQNKKVAAIGLSDIVIIDTENGLLVCHKKDSKRVKEILDLNS